MRHCGQRADALRGKGGNEARVLAVLALGAGEDDRDTARVAQEVSDRLDDNSSSRDGLTGRFQSIDAASWDSATDSDASWDSASWSDASWTDASWADASWADASWVD